MGGDSELMQLAKMDRNPVEETRYQELLKASGGGGSNLATYDNLLNGMPKAQDMVSSLNAGENQAFGDYFNYLKSQDTPLQTYQKLSEASGIPQLRQSQKTLQGQIYDLEDSLRRIEPDVSATTSNSLVTEAQRRGIVTERQKPLIENLGWLGQSLGRVSSSISELNQQALNLTQLDQQGIERLMGAYKDKLALAQSQGSRALEAFINDTNNVLNVSLRKIARGEAIDDQEAQFAHELLMSQKQAEQRIKELEWQKENGGDNELITLSEGQTLFDPNTMKPLYIAPKTYNPNASNTIESVDISKYLTPKTPTSNNHFGIDSTIYSWIMGEQQ